MKIDFKKMRPKNFNSYLYKSVKKLAQIVEKGSGNINHIYRPYATSYTFYTGQRTGLSGGNLRGYKANGVYKNQTSTTGLKIIFDSNVTFGKFSVYGVI